MKKILLFCFLFSLIGCGCATTTTTIVMQGNPDPAGDAYKHVLIRNATPFFTTFSVSMGDQVILGPGEEMIVMSKKRPFGSIFGRFSFVVHAYREYNDNKLNEFVGSNRYYIYLNGYTCIYQGRVFGDVVVMRYFPNSPFPLSWEGNFIVPWKIEIKR